MQELLPQCPTVTARIDELNVIFERSVKARRMTQADAMTVVRITDATVTALGFDPRTEPDPSEVVPLHSSVRAAILEGDNAALWRAILAAQRDGSPWAPSAPKEPA
ncbi:hypothetical protein D7V88_40200 [Corallococcus terminator]|uniref:Uncharacterized protein n=2 Tax=Corallococcus terminator TaxID=2316733 RepID=A0A3A8HFV8_9BACT|nr:hypothetical protein D7V88_40200 [Corallococcus terminator]